MLEFLRSFESDAVTMFGLTSFAVVLFLWAKFLYLCGNVLVEELAYKCSPRRYPRPAEPINGAALAQAIQPGRPRL